MLGAHRLTLAALAGCAVLCAAVPQAGASNTQASILQDDLHLVYSSQAQAVRTMQTLASLGADWVKISMIWGIVAPDPHSTRRPAFDASDPAAYPPGAWSRYDLLVALAGSLGLKVYFQFVPPTPRWAFDRRFPAREGKHLGHVPDALEFERFVTAVGRRYGGVRIWGIWNEPNYPAWLQPVRRRLAGGMEQKTQPLLYRGLVDAAWRGLQASGHGGDTVLIGETANPGNESPLSFLRDLYCLDPAYRPLAGAAAARVGCPTSPDPARFMTRHPALFAASGWAHHPYSFDVAPNRRYPVRSWITLYNIGELERALDRALRSYGAGRGAGMPLYVSEWGYRTNPPNPFVKTSLGEQQRWLDEGDYMTWRLPYVHSISNFQLYDGPPQTRYPRSNPKRYFNFQTGLLYWRGAPKPSFASYRLPLWLPSQRHGPRVKVWGQLRAANHASLQTAAIEFRRSAREPWTTIGEAETSSPHGFFLAIVAIPSGGSLRVSCRDARTGGLDHSRTVRIA